MISDARMVEFNPFLMTSNDSLLRRRLRNVIIHEVGHNMGLGHCANNECIMSEQSGGFAVLDRDGKTYCTACLKKLEH